MASGELPPRVGARQLDIYDYQAISSRLVNAPSESRRRELDSMVLNIELTLAT